MLYYYIVNIYYISYANLNMPHSNLYSHCKLQSVTPILDIVTIIVASKEHIIDYNNI